MNGSRDVAIWGAVAAFFGNLVAFKALTLIAGGDVRLGVSALFTSGCVAGVVYARSRYDTAKRKEQDGNREK